MAEAVPIRVIIQDPDGVQVADSDVQKELEQMGVLDAKQGGNVSIELDNHHRPKKGDIYTVEYFVHRVLDPDKLLLPTEILLKGRTAWIVEQDDIETKPVLEKPNKPLIFTIEFKSSLIREHILVVRAAASSSLRPKGVAYSAEASVRVRP
jgi:hypothetical protein